MNYKSIASAFAGVLFMGAASAADITIYYSPTCPHCHHAREFISETLVYEYPSLKVTQVNVMDEANLDAFRAALAKCEYESGGVPVMVIGEKCFQGYADFMQQDVRAAIEADMSDSDKQVAAENKAELEKDATVFKAANAERANAIAEYDATAAAADAPGGSSWLFWVVLAALVLGLGAIVVKKSSRK